MLTDLPYKVLNSICFNLILYFMTNLRREPGELHHFGYSGVSFMAHQRSLRHRRILLLPVRILHPHVGDVNGLPLDRIAVEDPHTSSRSRGDLDSRPDHLHRLRHSRGLHARLVPLDELVSSVNSRRPFRASRLWYRARLRRSIDPIAYGFEALMVNEFSGRDFTCSVVIPSGPGYENVSPQQQVCQTTGSTAGSLVVNGDSYLGVTYQYYSINKWRNIGIIFVFILGFLAVYLIATGEPRVQSL